jgi:hypothetical protein
MRSGSVRRSMPNYISKSGTRGLSEAESILGMTEALALGARCLDDLDVARGDQMQEAMHGFGVPSL